MGHRSPHDQKKYEQDVGREIYSIVKMLRECSRELGADPGVRVDPQLYYDDRDHPSQFAELRLDNRTSLRMGLERRRLSAGGWGLGWNIFADGLVVEEGEVQAPQVNFLRPTIEQVVERYAHVSSSLGRS
jgi:hypothetical protein